MNGTLSESNVLRVYPFLDDDHDTKLDEAADRTEEDVRIYICADATHLCCHISSELTVVYL